MQYGRVNCINALNSIPVGVKESAKSNSVEITAYYNGQGELIITYDLKDKNNSVATLYDILGKKILQLKLPANQNQANVSVNELPHGMYLLNVQSVDGVKLSSKKFIKY